MAAEAAIRAWVACGEPYCGMMVAPTDWNRCVGCQGYFCHRHRESRTMHDGDAANVCLDCSSQDAEQRPGSLP